MSRTAEINARLLFLGADPSKVEYTAIPVKVEIPKKLACLLRKLYNEVKTEFTLYIYGEVTPWPIVLPGTDEIKVKIEDYYIPKQTASYANVDGLETPPLRQKDGKVLKVLGTIHKHPEGLTLFSSVDHEHTNSKFPINLLFTVEYDLDEKYGIFDKFGRLKSVLKDPTPKLVAISFWFVDNEVLCQNIVKSVEFNDNKIVLNLSDSKVIQVKAKIGVSRNISVEEYGDCDEKEVEKEAKEAVKKINASTWDSIGIEVETEADEVEIVTDAPSDDKNDSASNDVNESQQVSSK